MRWLITLLLCVALPLQGWAAAGGMALSMQRDAPETQAAHAAPAASIAAVATSAAHEGCEGHLAAQAAPDAEGHGPCSHCGACCLGSALLPALPSLALHRAVQSWGLSPLPALPGHPPERLERPPRA